MAMLVTSGSDWLMFCMAASCVLPTHWFSASCVARSCWKASDALTILAEICCRAAPLPLSRVPEAPWKSLSMEVNDTPVKSSTATAAGLLVVPVMSCSSSCEVVSDETSLFVRLSNKLQSAPGVFCGSLPELIMSSICSAVSAFLW
ncbi:hypothetical protein AWC23_06140 [Mycobacterium saskatchewanense]|uniref:Uncharacterized protein n=1 Tax=Mycobacterium saskatchewanense TaxID=220927 RepID=A0AAJ3NU24_9MYCO|nr:hypothetical protein AWC23_06140 [Mycobacterium saskatchewanense]